MRVAHVDGIESRPVEMEGASGVRIRVAIGEGQGAPNFVMRVFDVEAGGHTPHHAHDFEHEVFVLGGRGSHVEEGKVERLESGDVVYVAPGVEHQFRAAEDAPLRFICVVPRV